MISFSKFSVCHLQFVISHESISAILTAMPEYAAFLGHEPKISIAELAVTVPGFDLEHVLTDSIALFSSDAVLSSDFVSKLGGITILAQRLSDNDLEVADVPKVLASEIGGLRGKVTFSLRTYGVPKNRVKMLYRDGKATLKKLGKPCRYVGSEVKAAPTVLLHDLDLFSGKKGCEITVLQWKTVDEEDAPVETWIGRTVGAQNIKHYSWLDMQKPVRDTGIGLLPPKLAQMLLNFGLWILTDGKTEQEGKKRSKQIVTVYDPFCGTGVIPLECLLRGWNVLASDLSQKAVNGCAKNIEWIRKERKILKKEVNSEVWKQDATKPTKEKIAPDMIVTETSLGPALTDRATVKDVKKFISENERLQEDFLRNMATQFPGVPVVCTWPAWRQKGGWTKLEKIWKLLPEIGYAPVMSAAVSLDDPKRFSLLYARKDQFVGREIVLLRSTKAKPA
jgi:hypothetical protein